MFRSGSALTAAVLSVFVLALMSPARAAETPPTNPHAVPNPNLVKIPMAYPGPRMENTPVIYQGRPLLVQNVRPPVVKVKDYYLFIEDLRNGEEVARFGETFSFVSAFVNGDEMNIFATENTDDDWTHDIYRFRSTDLKNWEKTLAIARRPGEHLFNASVCRDPEGYLMAFESNVPVQWSCRLARSKDLATWEEVEGISLGDTAEQSAFACPALRYFAPYYYLVFGGWRWNGPGVWYEYRLDETRYVTFLARSKDLATWELAPTTHPFLDPIPGEGINNTDADLFEWEGNTYVYYATGDQQTWGTIRIAMYSGPMEQLFKDCFPEGVPMVTFDAREGKYTYPEK